MTLFRFTTHCVPLWGTTRETCLQSDPLPVEDQTVGHCERTPGNYTLLIGYVTCCPLLPFSEIYEEQRHSSTSHKSPNFCLQQSCISQPDWKLSYKSTRTRAYSGNIRRQAANKRKTHINIRGHQDIWPVI